MKSSKSNSKNGGFNMWQADLGNGKYRNPILYADYSDPDAIRVGEDYFMIASSFFNAPEIGRARLNSSHNVASRMPSSA